MLKGTNISGVGIECKGLILENALDTSRKSALRRYMPPLFLRYFYKKSNIVSNYSLGMIAIVLSKYRSSSISSLATAKM